MVTRACLRYAREGQNVTQAGPKCHTSRAKMSHSHVIIGAEQATSHYLKHCWHIVLTRICVTRPQCVICRILPSVGWYWLFRPRTYGSPVTWAWANQQINSCHIDIWRTPKRSNIPYWCVEYGESGSFCSPTVRILRVVELRVDIRQ